MINPKKLRESLQGEVYSDLREYLTLHCEELRNIDNVKEYSRGVDQAIEIKAQKKAYEKVANILSSIIVLHSEKEVERTSKNDYLV